MLYSKIEPERSEYSTFVIGLSGLISVVGTEAFSDRISDLLSNSFNVIEYLVFQRSASSETPVILHSKGQDGSSENRARSYCNGFYRLDPIFSVLDGGNPDGSYAIHVRKDEIGNAAFRDACYSRPGISEKLTLARKEGGKLIAISLFGHDVNGGFDAEHVSELSQFGNLLLSILDLHFRLLGNQDRQKNVSSAEMEDCVSWAFPELTKREVAVCARTILGVTAEGIALDLGIAQTSVLTYRRRAYARLNINSINQLSTMLIQSSAARQLAAA